MTREQLLEVIRELGVEYAISIDDKNILSIRFWVEGFEDASDG